MNRALRPTVIAFGGNALVRREDHATQRLQIERSDRLAREILPMLREGRPLALVHGNGPQVGDELIRREDGRLVGVEAVVDKDYVAEMVARRVDADRLLVLTDVDQVCLDFGSPTQRPLARLNLAEAEAHLRTGQFPPGSMGPKIEAAVQFVQATGGEVLITSPESLAAALAGKTGTRVVP